MKTKISSDYNQLLKWTPMVPKLKLRRLFIAWLLSALGLSLSAALLPGVELNGFLAALDAVLLIALINAIFPPLFAALRIPYMLIIGFFVILLMDAVALILAADLSDGKLQFDSFGWAVATAVLSSALVMFLELLFNINEHDQINLRIIAKIAKKTKDRELTNKPGMLFLEVDGLSFPVIKRAIRDGYVPNIAMLLGESHKLIEWETDLSSQTGASQAAILLGSNNNIPAFRWIEKKTNKVMTCSTPKDCTMIENRLLTDGLLAGGGASRSNLFSGGAKYCLLVPSKMDAEKAANPGYRSFYANGFNVTRSMALFFKELFIEYYQAFIMKRRNIMPRGHRGGKYPFIRAGLVALVRDILVQTVIADIMKGRPAIYATFAGYDEVAHHSGLERPDTLEVLRKIDEQFGIIIKSLTYAARPYEIVILSDHGQTQGATFKQRRGYGLEDLVNKAIGNNNIVNFSGGDENDTAVNKALNEAIGRKNKTKTDKADTNEVVVFGSGNLGLIYLLNKRSRLTLEEINQNYPKLISSLLSDPYIGWISLDTENDGPVVMSKDGRYILNKDTATGVNPLQNFSANASAHIKRANNFNNSADIIVNSFYNPDLDEACAFEELISFHGGMGGPQTRPFIIYPTKFKLINKQILGAENLHKQFMHWRKLLQNN